MVRKDFEPWKVELVYKQQDGVCLKCSKSLAKGFHRHHKDGKPSNNNVENLELLCPQCHGGEAYDTYKKKKMKALGTVEATIQMALDKGLSGAALDKLLDAIKLGLSLTEQLYDPGIEKPPAAIRMENYLISSGILLKEYEKGFREGMLHASEAVASQLLKLMVANKQQIALIELLSKKAKEKK